MIEGLRRAGVDVVECHARLWNSVEDRVSAASGGWRNLRFLWQLLTVYLTLVQRYFRIGDYDMMVVGYPGQMDVYLAWLLTRLRRRPLVWDVFMSIYLIALERGLERRSRFTVNMIRLIERWACRLPESLILDTREYVEWFQRQHEVGPDRFCLVPTGADDRVYYPIEVVDRNPRFTAIYYGTFIRNHGVLTIVEAARLLSDVADIRFVLVGEGPEKAAVSAAVRQYGLANVELMGWMRREELVAQVAQADICLGVFGTTPQSLMTVQNKIYEALAMQKPLITGDSATVRNSFVDGEHLVLVNRTDPHDLAEKILQLWDDPDQRAQLAIQGYQRYCESFSTRKLGELTRSHLEAVLANRRQ
jgi:glycosyltransferase involved in cell wall biosynthesis